MTLLYRMQLRRQIMNKKCRKMQDMRDARHRRDAGQGGCRTGWMQPQDRRYMQDRVDAGQEGCRTGGMQDRMDAGQKRWTQYECRTGGGEGGGGGGGAKCGPPPPPPPPTPPPPPGPPMTANVIFVLPQ